MVLAGLIGCSGDDEPGADATEPPPALGGDTPTESAPSRAMDDMERTIAERLADQVAALGLHVDQLQCPRWDKSVPAALVCQGWFDGVRGEVRVHLATDDEGMVVFDAELRGGVLATAKLVDELESAGYTEVDCGDAPAYPTVVGSTITCAVTGADGEDFVVATVTDDQGKVEIGDL